MKVGWYQQWRNILNVTEIKYNKLLKPLNQSVKEKSNKTNNRRGNIVLYTRCIVCRITITVKQKESALPRGHVIFVRV